MISELIAKGRWKSSPEVPILASIQYNFPVVPEGLKTMPIYEYQCASCGHELEKLQRMSDAPLKDCPDCGQPELKRLISAAGFRLKGGGWYETDFKKGSQRNLHDSGGKADQKADQGSGEAKPAAKPVETPKADSKPASSQASTQASSGSA
jgi:putative FmdB family regulatory protein